MYAVAVCLPGLLITDRSGTQQELSFQRLGGKVITSSFGLPQSCAGLPNKILSYSIEKTLSYSRHGEGVLF